MTARQQRDDAWSGVGTGWSVTTTMIGGVAAWGGIGFLLDRLLGTSGVFFAIGVVLGAAAATYLVWLRYGRDQD
jgi:ATP synthase protein I